MRSATPDRTKQSLTGPARAFPGGEIYLSFPGLGHRLAARIAGEIGEHIEQFTTPKSLQCYAGRAPVTRRSGKRDLVVAHRLACNRYLADAVHKRAFASLRRSAWAREVYAVASHAIGFADPRPSDHSPGVGAYEDDEENWSGLTHVDNGIC